MNRVQKLLLLLRQGIVYQLVDLFPEDFSAGSVDGTLSNSGHTRDVTDTENKISISGGELLIASGKAAPAWGDPRFSYEESFARVAGRTLAAQLQATGLQLVRFGWDDDTSGDAGEAAFDIDASRNLASYDGGSLGADILQLANDTAYELYKMLRETGDYGYASGGEFGSIPILVSINDTRNNTPLYPVLLANNPTALANPKIAIADMPVSVPVASDTFDSVVAVDSGDNGLDGTHVLVGLNGSAGQYGGDGHTDIYSAALIVFFNPVNGTLIQRLQVPNADIWVDATFHQFVALRADANNRVFGFKDLTDNRISVFYRAGGVQQAVVISGLSTLNEFGIATSWDKGVDEFRAFLDGSQSGATQSGLGVWVGALDSAKSVVGADSTAPSVPWKGLIADTVLGNITATPAQIATIDAALAAETLTSADLDTIFGSGNWAWWKNNELHTTNGLVAPIDVAGSGAGLTWLGNTHATDDNKAFSTIIPGADVIDDGDFGSSDGWDEGTGWAIAAGVATKTAGTASDLGQTVDPLAAGTWYRLTHKVANRTAGIITPKFGTTPGVARSTNATFVETGVANGAAFDLSADASFDGDEDDVVMQPLVLADLLQLTEQNRAFAFQPVKLTIPDDTQAGVAACWDDWENPANGIIAYCNQVDAKIYLITYVAGVLAVVASAAFTYSAGTPVCLYPIKDDLTVWNVKYDGNAIIKAATINDAGIISNTLHGLFLPNGPYAEDYRSVPSLRADLLRML